MDKLLVGVFWGIAIVLILIAGAFGFKYVKEEYDKNKVYDKFCEERPNFCYCGWGGCEFKTSWDSMKGLSEDTKELCELAKSLNDKEIIFKAGCEE